MPLSRWWMLDAPRHAPTRPCAFSVRRVFEVSMYNSSWVRLLRPIFRLPSSGTKLHKPRRRFRRVRVAFDDPPFVLLPRLTVSPAVRGHTLRIATVMQTRVWPQRGEHQRPGWERPPASAALLSLCCCCCSLSSFPPPSRGAEKRASAAAPWLLRACVCVCR